jgi:hypothetical protein
MMAFGNWETQWIVKPGSATGISVRAGLSYPGSVVGLPPAIGYWVQYDTSQSDTAWTGVTPTATDWYRIRIRSTVTGTVLFSVATNGGPFSAEQSVCAAGCNATGAMPSVQMVPFVQVATYTAGAAAFVDFDWFGALVTGLAR